jgi:hypothetical protein
MIVEHWDEVFETLIVIAIVCEGIIVTNVTQMPGGECEDSVE